MQVGGIEATKEAIFGPLPFKRGKDILAFFAQPVWDMDEFNVLCPPPVNRNYRFTKGGKELDPDAPVYKEALAAYGRKRWGYIVMKSLEPSNIKWNKVKADDPETWLNVEEELRETLAHFEFSKLMELVHEANALDEEKLAENAKLFFQRTAQQADPSENSPDSEVANS